MYAHVNIPGSSSFETFGPASKQECEDWLKDQEQCHKEVHGGLWVNTYFPAKVLSNKEAMKWKYRDGSKVFDRCERWQ